MVLFVGNLTERVTKSDLLRLFGSYGNVMAVEVIKDKHTGRSRGFAFIKMQENSEAMVAVRDLHNEAFMSAKLVVTEKGPRHPVRTSFNNLPKEIKPLNSYE